jgi:predicted kinase
MYWFQVEFTDLWSDMEQSTHAAVPGEPNPYHLEGSIATHTMMVCQRAEIDEVHKLNKICALLHDIGKPKAMETIPFETKKPVHSESNELRNAGMNDGKDSGMNREVPKSGLKKHFRGHEGLSFYLAIEPLNRLKDLGVLTQKEVKDCLIIISMHGTLFDNISEDGEMKKEGKVFEKFGNTEQGLFLFERYVSQVRCDSLGRFFTSKDGRKNNALKLGTEIFTKEQFKEYFNNKKMSQPKQKEADITVLIGAPGSGKSTYLNRRIYAPESVPVVISRDNELLDFAKEKFGSYITYSEAWHKLSEEDHKEIDKNYKTKFENAKRERKNIVADLTNMSNKTQRKWTNSVSDDYFKVAIVFATEYNEIFKRLEKREKEENKIIPKAVIAQMMKGFMVPNYSNFDYIKFVF